MILSLHAQRMREQIAQHAKGVKKSKVSQWGLIFYQTGVESKVAHYVMIMAILI